MQGTQEKWVQSLGWEDPLGGRNGNPLQYSCLENFMDRGAWQATVCGKELDMTEHARITYLASKNSLVSECSFLI